ncbi:MAG: hypothetical protein U0744_14280 [Gemmataceae bacterium]
MILLIDNYDSFTYNLVQRLGEMDPDIALGEVRRNDEITLDDIAAMKPEPHHRLAGALHAEGSRHLERGAAAASPQRSPRSASAWAISASAIASVAK